MAQFINEKLNKDEERKKYEEYLEKAKANANPELIPDDYWEEYWDFLCLHNDCMCHDFTRYRRHKDGEIPEDRSVDIKGYEEELMLAAECEVICGILSRKPKFCFA